MAKDKIIVISTHILEEVDAVCNRAIIIAHGRILADDTPEAPRARARRAAASMTSSARSRRPAKRGRQEAGACITSLTVFRREFASYFATPLAFVFIVIFLCSPAPSRSISAVSTSADRRTSTPFFNYHPWLYLFLIPALSMRLWAEERKSGTIELLMTLPVTTWQAVLGKYLAAWCFAGLALALTFPMWITVNYLGDPDNGAILAAYIGSFLMAGGFLAIGSCLSAATRNQVIAFIFTRRDLLPVPAVRVLARARPVRGLGAATGSRRDRLAVVPHAFRFHRQGRDRRARPVVFRSS